MSYKCKAVKNFNLKNPSWRTAVILKIEELRHFLMIQNGSLKHICRLPSEIKKKNLTAGALEKSIIVPHFVEIGHAEITIFRISSKM